MFHEQMRRYFEKSQGKIRKLPHPFLFSFEIEVDKILLEILGVENLPHPFFIFF